MTHDINALLEQYNLVGIDNEDGFNDCYWSAAEALEQRVFENSSLQDSEVIETLCEHLDVDESSILIDEIEDFITELFTIVQ